MQVVFVPFALSVFAHLSSPQNYCNTTLVLLGLGVSETLHGYPMCDTSGNTEILTADTGRPSFVHDVKFETQFCLLLI